MVLTYIFQAVQILVAFATDLAFVRLLLFHTECAWIWCRGFRIDNGECSVAIFVEALCLMAMSLVISTECKRLAKDPLGVLILTSNRSGSYKPSHNQ